MCLFKTYLLTCCFVVCVDVQQWVMMTDRELLSLHINTKVINIYEYVVSTDSEMNVIRYNV